MGHGRKETHPWLFDKNNNRRVQNFSEATGRIDAQQAREEGQQAGEPLDAEMGLGMCDSCYIAPAALEKNTRRQLTALSAQHSGNW